MRSYFHNAAFMLTLVPMFLIISSSVYPAIISGIQNKEMALIADALAQLDGRKEANRVVGVDTSGQHSGFSLTDKLIFPTTSPTDISPLDSGFTTQAALSSLTARPTNNIVNTNSFYDVVFLAASPGAIKTIQVTFPAGTTIPSGAFFNEAEKCVPGNDCTELSGTASKSGQTITYTLTNAVNVPAGTKIRLEFANINNPLNPSASYKVTATTRNAANAIIDGPTQSTAYTMKQIGKNAIANKAVTDPKLSLDSVYTVWDDSTNPGSDVFYKRKTVSFDQAEDLSQNVGTSTNAAVSAASNKVYIVWQDDQLGNSEILFRRSTDGGLTFGSTINLSNNAGISDQPAIASSGNNVYVVWQDDIAGNNEILYRRSTDGGLTFGSTILILSNNAGFSQGPDIAASGNNVHVVWFDDNSGNNEILYKRSVNSGESFGAVQNISNNTGDSDGPAIAVAGSNVYVVWPDNTGSPAGVFDIVYKRSTNSGSSFGAVQNLSNNAGASTEPTISASGSNVYIAWNDETSGNFEILYRRSTNSGISFASTINLSNNQGTSFGPEISNPNNDNVYIVWSDDTLGNSEILYRKSTNQGVTFGNPTNLSNTPGTSFAPDISSLINLPA